MACQFGSSRLGKDSPDMRVRLWECTDSHTRVSMLFDYEHCCRTFFFFRTNFHETTVVARAIFVLTSCLPIGDKVLSENICNHDEHTTSVAVQHVAGDMSSVTRRGPTAQYVRMPVCSAPASLHRSVGRPCQQGRLLRT